jgi:hypothetical protein
MYRFDGNAIIKPPSKLTPAVKNGIKIFLRDMKAVFGIKPVINKESNHFTFQIKYTDESVKDIVPESYRITFETINERTVLILTGADDLGIIYGLFHISEKYLNIDPFWFWADIEIKHQEFVSIPAKPYDSPPQTVRYRGWFVNDEVCLLGWKEEYPPTEDVWRPVFEALLRCGGNMVIPGTDLPRDGIHHKLASEMGLWLTHHHAEPLGAEMFLRAFPGKEASYMKNKHLFEKLWIEAIEKQKDDKIVWVLSFRGQGDQPFWALDPSYDTPEKRGALISQVIHRQYHLLKEYVEEPVCSIALYGEISELYTAGHLDLPPNVIKVWADNGYGKMVSRRQGLENYRIPSLPDKNDNGKHGVYYHVTFHDLQASNHLTLSPYSPNLIIDELLSAFEVGATDYLLVNSGNIRQHLYTLDIVSKLWKDGDLDLEEHLQRYVNRMFSSGHEEIIQLFDRYFKASISYGKLEDEKAGDEFYHHPARQIIGHWIKGNTAHLPSLSWATGNLSFDEQVDWFYEKCKVGLKQLSELRRQCISLMDTLKEEDKMRLEDQLLFPIELHYSGCKGFQYLCMAYQQFQNQHYPLAFVYASESLWSYQKGLLAQKRAEYGKWKNFYRMDYLTNIQSTVNNVDTLRKFIRMHGDSPDFFRWYKEYIMPESEKYIYLENTHREVKSDDVLARLLKKQFVLEQ